MKDWFARSDPTLGCSSSGGSHSWKSLFACLVDERGPSLVGFLQNLKEGLAQPHLGGKSPIGVEQALCIQDETT